MTVNDLILIDSTKVRRSPDLMAFYIQSFKEAFGYSPNCAGCTFNNDFNKLKQTIYTGQKSTSIQKNTFMGTFKLKKIQGKIFAFTSKDKKVHRSYDNNFTTQFVDGFLTNGTAAEIVERKAMFAILPEKFSEKTSDENASADGKEPNTKSARGKANKK